MLLNGRPDVAAAALSVQAPPNARPPLLAERFVGPRREERGPLGAHAREQVTISRGLPCRWAGRSRYDRRHA